MAFTFFFRDMDSIKLIPRYVFSDLDSDDDLDAFFAVGFGGQDKV